MKLLSIQIAMFSVETILRPDLLKDEINNKIGGKLDGMPTILNLPQDAPAEIPIVQVRSLNNFYELHVSRNRVDFFINPDFNINNEPYDVFKQYKYIIEKFYKTVLNSTKVNRAGTIFTLFEPLKDNVEAIFKKYLNESYVSGNGEITLRTNRQIMDKGIIFNNIRLIEAAEVPIKNEFHKGVIVQFDINNVPKSDLLLNESTVAEIVDKASGYIKNKEVKGLI